ncbi:SOS response-associated peptidase [Corynebacterium pseudopelargi]|uniref:Abasic site processing protein n=1 Tax=Corynebacterium pseudopelargi TaxID=2080757 RepID=A0A3G6J0D3_9CORY|nr:SOS response-associated peptidase [Corynebacterium pseudopelargi]AZA09810.1 Putative SOS response-associated peptidase YedK [Corynebacterium pseudopelargi]
MCGRFVLFTTEDALIEAARDTAGYEQVTAPQGLPRARYNIAPTTPIAILRAHNAQEASLEPARWGLIPHWKRDDSGPPLFNARAETVREKPSFRSAFQHGRCAIPMDGYYEWHNKQPYWISTGHVIWVAGLVQDNDGQLSATMITTDSEAPLEWIHHRMPRFLAPGQIKQWMLGSDEEAAELLVPGPTEGFEAKAADPAVGNVRNDYPELLQPAGLF